MLLNAEQQKSISQAIENIEKETDAELITVLAKRSDNYYYIPTLWAALIALLVPVALYLTDFWISFSELLFIQWLVFIVLGLGLRIPFVMMRLVPERVKYGRASNLARRQFLENGLHHTKDQTGVLIFVSEAEHFVEIIADRGISQYVSNEQWQEIVDAFIVNIKAGKTQQGFLECLKSCAVLLRQYAPATAQKNELPNHLILL